MALPSDTRWSCILAARDPQDSRYEEAWRYLFATYREVIRGYFVRWAGDRSDALDWADEFMAAWVDGSLDRADPDVGSFRRYLFVSLRHFGIKRANDRRRRRVAPLDREPPAIEADRDDHDRLFARHVLSIGLESLHQYQLRQQGRGQPNRGYDLLRATYLDVDAGETAPTGAMLAERFGLTPKAVEHQLAHAREKLRGFLMTQLSETVDGPAELQAEVGLLVRHCRDVVGELRSGDE